MQKLVLPKHDIVVDENHQAADEVVRCSKRLKRILELKTLQVEKQREIDREFPPDEGYISPD